MEALGAMYVDIEKAKRSVDLEVFIFDIDEQGELFAKLLADKAKSGLKVRLIVDYAGRPSFVGSTIEKRMREAGVEVAIWNPISLWRISNFTSWYFRDHRKMLIIDGKVGYTGGVNIRGASYFRRDTQVRITGQVLEQISLAFARMWQNYEEGQFSPFGKAPEEDGFYFLTNSPHRRERHILREVMSKVRRAKTRAYLTAPYFVPSLRFFRRILSAARRGVDVRVIVPGLSDRRIADLAAQSYFTIMLKAGVRVYRYNKPYLHAKTIVIDDTWSMVGSFNLDNLSFLYNYEASLISTRADFAYELAGHFEQDLLNCQEILHDIWIKRPFASKVAEALTWPFHFLM